LATGKVVKKSIVGEVGTEALLLLMGPVDLLQTKD
jgi:hypothetical protein